jgi:D-serine deaminase-like pyridoxal phosphate-dependent protein
LKFLKFSEHGWISRENEKQSMEIGERLRIIPNHSCPVANLSEEYVVVDGATKEIWKVDAGRKVK